MPFNQPLRAGYAGIPPGPLSAYLGVQAANRGQDMETLQGAGAVQGLLAKMQMMQREEQFRTEISQAKTQEEQLAIAGKFMGPDALGKMIQTSQDRQAHERGTQATNMLRLQQAARQFDATWDLRYRAAKDRTEQMNLEREKEAFKQQLQSEAARLGGAKASYDFGFTPNAQPTPTVSSPTQPPQGNLASLASQGNLASLASQYGGELQGRPQDEQAAIASVFAAGNRPARAELGNFQPVPQPSAQPAQPTAPVPLTYSQGGLAPDITPKAVPAPPSPATGAPGAVTSPKFVTWMDAPVGMRQKDAEEWARDQNRQIGGQSAPERTPESLRDDVYYQVMNGVPRPGSIPTGRAGQGNAYRAQFAEELNKVSRELNLTPQELATRGRENKSKFVALSAVEKDLAALTPYKEMLDQNATIAIDLGKKIANDKTNSAFLNKPLLWLKNNVSNKPDIAEYLAQMHFVEVEGARVLTNPRLVGQLTDSAISDMKSVVSGNMTLDSSERVLRRMMTDGDNRINKMRTQRERTISEIRGTTPQSRATDTQSIIDQADEIIRRSR